MVDVEEWNDFRLPTTCLPPSASENRTLIPPHFAYHPPPLIFDPLDLDGEKKILFQVLQKVLVVVEVRCPVIRSLLLPLSLSAG